ncbi:MAG: hypothetical protein KatS3mg067_1041 [Thermosynechococcus sp.]|uniref:hypothetical protein n=1 Tax=Thermosynechococcus sp. TaxID=2814275 RepID=UPI002201F782|nr:hypothetical protein [Thermosynechococcus sp.]BCX12103.1 MAG: hypothetical protein KatS3mg067_1041 [Thermosynechococcus sp.]
MFNAFMHVPYQTQLAYGWTSLAVKTNLVAVALLLPAIAILVPRYGAIASAWVWCILNAGYVLLPIHFMYRRLLTREKAAWYWHAVINPLLIATLLLSLVKAFLLPLILIPLAQIGAIAATAAVCGMAICLVSPALRPTLVAFVRKWQPAAQ